MPEPEICIIAAISENNVIGNSGRIPWHISADLKRFKELTMGHPIIMGRKTFESIGKPLPGRENIVISRKITTIAGCICCQSLEEAIQRGKLDDEERVFIIGGEEVYNQAIDMADRLFLTIAKGSFSGDTSFPDYSTFSKVVSEEPGEENGIMFRFIELTK